MDGGDWRNCIINQLHVRNRRETAAFQDIVAFQSRLFDNVNTLKNENLQLTLQNERIRFSGADSIQPGGSGGSNEKIQALEQKILAQQEELTSLHRRRGESSQQIINLNDRVHELEKQVTMKDVTISENAALLASLRAEIQMYETNMAELQTLNQVIRDEHQALQIAFAALEEKLRKIQDENRTLVERLIKYKAKDADKMNEENENFVKKKGEKVRKELEEACREGGSRSSSGSGGNVTVDDIGQKILESIPYYATTLPTKVALRFVGNNCHLIEDAHDGEVNAVRWSPTDRIVATGGADRKASCTCRPRIRRPQPSARCTTPRSTAASSRWSAAASRSAGAAAAAAGAAACAGACATAASGAGPGPCAAARPARARRPTCGTRAPWGRCGTCAARPWAAAWGCATAWAAARPTTAAWTGRWAATRTSATAATGVRTGAASR